MKIADVVEAPARSRRARMAPYPLALVLGATAAFLAAGGRDSGRNAPAPPSAAGPSVERGNYLTHEVAMCVQCHSPRDASGRIIESQEFRGAPMPLLSHDERPNARHIRNSAAIGHNKPSTTPS